MKPTAYSSKRRMKMTLSLILSFTLLFGLLSSLTARPIEAKSSSRVAIVKEVGGTVTVHTAGSSNEYDAYEDMSLNQGDYITTGDDSYVVLNVKDTEDEVTIGANAEVYIADLASAGSGKKSKLKMWAGSMWTKVKKLAGADDFEVETPTAVMGVRGTNVAFGVDPETGETFAAVAAGSVSAETNSGDGDTEGDPVLLAPSQQYKQSSRDETKDLENNVGMVDLEELISRISGKVIEAMVKSKQDIDRENEEFYDKQKKSIENGEETTISRGNASSSLGIKDQAELDKVKQNLDNLLGNVVKKAIETGKVDKQEIQQVIEQVNSNVTDPDKKLDLDKVKELDKSAGIDPELQKKKDEEKKRLEQIKKEQEDKQKELAAQIAKALEEALAKLKEEQKRLEEQRKAAAEEAKKKAEEEYLKKLGEDAKKKFEEDKKKADDAKNATPTPSPSATPKPSASPTATPGTGTGGDNGGTVSPTVNVTNPPTSLGYMRTGTGITDYVYSVGQIGPWVVGVSTATVDNELLTISSDGKLYPNGTGTGTARVTVSYPGYISTSFDVKVFEVKQTVSAQPAVSPTQVNVKLELVGQGEFYGAEVHYAFPFGQVDSSSVTSGFFDSHAESSSREVDSVPFEFIYASIFVPSEQSTNKSFNGTLSNPVKLLEFNIKNLTYPNYVQPISLKLVRRDGSVFFDQSWNYSGPTGW